MISGIKDRSSIAISISIYRFLLAAYPAEFRQEYGEDMLQLFRDCTLRAASQSGSEGMVRLWAVTFLDLIQSLFKEHLQKETNMSKSTFIRISGWALVLAGIAFPMVLTGWYLEDAYPLMHIDKSFFMDFSYIASIYAGPIFLTLGLLGLRSRYGQNLGSGANAVLLFCAIGGQILSLVGIIGGDGLLIGHANDALWDFIVWGPIVQMIGLTIFGIIAVQKKPLPWGNGLGLLSAVFPVAFIISAFQANLDTSFTTILFALLVFQFLGTIMVGFILQRDALQQDAAMAAV